MRKYLVEGLSGTGKTTVCEELRKRGYRVVDADEELAYFADPKTGLPVDEKTTHWMWNEEKFHNTIKDNPSDYVFICGGATNQEDFKHHFDKIFTLHVDDLTLKHRLQNRTNNDYGKEQRELEQQLEWNKGTKEYSKQRGTVLIDATRPIDVVVDEIISNI